VQGNSGATISDKSTNFAPSSERAGTATIELQQVAAIKHNQIVNRRKAGHTAANFQNGLTYFERMD
jgi:hypothetical protein